ncbi:methyltransferase domain-containing protein [Prosthecomicrobium pneumaticum]|uniref:SAM-dependent methyltransferase n=1 Tax=Prosthecomicrobium pneumaticum TaxID=81895 RepID=A0A7W9CV54_9HYPH|nr:methyltransferase domain-containing protein [Prosthecomicrobium pneumaticum]MBB5752465.1 SAM-dependent methyltransferase [Prosthecomicrobium pneumaticum]
MTERPRLFDKPALDRARARALAAAAPGADFLLARVGEDLVDRLSTVNRRFERALEIGSPTPALAASLVAAGRVGRVDRLDRLPQALGSGGIAGDPEALPLAEASVDLVVSALALQWVDDLPGALVQIRRALAPDGLFLAALIGGATLGELRTALTTAESELTGGASPRVFPFLDVRDGGALLQRAGFALPVADTETITVRYADLFALMRDLRAMGATNVLAARSRRPLPRAVLVRAAEIYAERFADPDGRIRARFEIVSLSGWAPSETQQKPLRPGSARASLADAVRQAGRSPQEG